jgi:hypothetical protein
VSIGSGRAHARASTLVAPSGADLNPISRVTASHGPILEHASTAALDATTSHTGRPRCREFANHTGDFDPRACSYHKLSGVDGEAHEFSGRRA